MLSCASFPSRIPGRFQCSQGLVHCSRAGVISVGGDVEVRRVNGAGEREEARKFDKAAFQFRETTLVFPASYCIMFFGIIVSLFQRFHPPHEFCYGASKRKVYGNNLTGPHFLRKIVSEASAASREAKSHARS
ncbi:MAG: hypothetical protein JWR19_805 [Pedosphaera sp.]|nr:hypothetical protein [Pedosphaera sp.]